MTQNRQKKIAIINDLSGYGRCSLTVAIPIISAMKVQSCPVPTSILSNHTGYPTYFFNDYTEKMSEYIQIWKNLQLEFDGIVTGFLGSKHQIGIVIDFIKHFKGKQTKIIIDPIMGDYGTVYKTYTPMMCEEMKQLVRYGDIVTPNLTEACILTDTEYETGHWKQDKLLLLARKLRDMGPKQVVITGVASDNYITNVVYEEGPDIHCIKTKKVGTQRPGTGDIFSSIIAADAVRGVSLEQSVKKASQFIKKSIVRSMELEIPEADGVCFEELLNLLIK